MTRGTNGRQRIFHTPAPAEGLHRIVSPANSELKHLSYDRLWVAEDHCFTLPGTERERALVCFGDGAVVAAAGTEYVLARHDVLYLPWKLSCTVTATGPAMADLAVIEAGATRDTRPQLIRFEEVKADPVRFTVAGEGVFAREVYTMVDQEKADACRLIIGFTWGQKGAWTSWPPHDHTEQLEEAYLYYDLPAPGFGIQLELSSFNEIELCEVVKEGDIAIMPNGGHPTVAAPNVRNKYLWAMAAHDDRNCRRTDLATVIPDFR